MPGELSFEMKEEIGVINRDIEVDGSGDQACDSPKEATERPFLPVYAVTIGLAMISQDAFINDIIMLTRFRFLPKCLRRKVT